LRKYATKFCDRMMEGWNDKEVEQVILVLSIDVFEKYWVIKTLTWSTKVTPVQIKGFISYTGMK